MRKQGFAATRGAMMNGFFSDLRSVFCMVVWGLLAATVAGVLGAVLVESCGASHAVTSAALVATFAGAFSAVCYVWKHD